MRPRIEPACVALVAIALAGGAAASADVAPPPPSSALPSQPPHVGPPPSTRPRLQLTAAMDPSARRISGTARWTIRNLADQALGEVRLWLYPNRLSVRPKTLGDVNFHWLYPGGFSPASMRIDTARVGSTAVIVGVESSAAGPATIARVPLPVPLPPGGLVEIQVDFAVELPVRLGNFGCAGSQCRLMGGFYPFPLHLGPGGFEAEAPPDRIDYAATVQVPVGIDAVLGDTHARTDGRSVTASDVNASYVTLLTDRDLRQDDVVAGGRTARFLHHKTRPPSSQDQVLPYVREDRAGLILEAIRRALVFATKEGLTPTAGHDGDAGHPLLVVEAPLRHELVHAHGGVILVSDRLFEIFPVERLRKFHRLELVRAILAGAVNRTLRQVEPDPDVDASTDVMAAYLTEVFTFREFRRVEFARELLHPVSFIPAVDQLMYAPLVASSSSYFGDLDDRDVVRDDVRRFSHRRASGRLVYAKLLDLLGPPGMTRLGRIVFGERVPLRRAAARVFGVDLDWFWRQWMAGPPPPVNYRLAAIRATPLAGTWNGARNGGGDGVHVRIDVQRQGADVLEPVEVRVVDRADVVHDLVWSDRGSAHTFDVDLPAGLASVEVDPRRRLVESALGSLDASDDPRADNRVPRRWRFIYRGFGALFDVTGLTASFAAALILKPQHDLHNSILLLAHRSPSTNVGIDAAYARLFGRQADTNRLTSDAGIGMTASLLNPDFGVASTETLRPHWRLSGNLFIEHDDRDYYIDPWRAIGASLKLDYSLTGLETGQRLSQVGAGVELLRLFELLPGHVLALDLQAGATFGDIRVRSQLADIGGPEGLRGYVPGELFGRGRAIGRLELRDRYVSDLDWNLAHFTSVRGFGGNLFVEAGVVTSCADLGAGRDDIFADVGYSFRVLHDAFGVYQQMLSIDLAVPLNRHDRVCLGQHSLGTPDQPGMTLSRPPFVVLISFLPTF